MRWHNDGGDRCRNVCRHMRGDIRSCDRADNRGEEQEMKLTHFSLCSGIGGLDLAAEWAGCETIGQCELDEYASRVLAKNFKGVKNYGDIRTITAERLEREGITGRNITVLSAGFPCQPYSLVGRGLGDGDSRDLWREVARILREVRPKWFVGENTPGLFARSNQRFFRRVIDDITENGYSVSWSIWGACDVGAPHQRNRVFILGSNTNSDDEKEECALSDGVESAHAARDNRNFPYAAGERFSKNEIQRGGFAESGRSADERTKDAQRVQFSRVCNGVSEHRREAAGDEWWKAEPGVGRVVARISNRVDRLRCLGNAVVPYQALPIFEVIAKIEKGEIEL